MPDALSTDERLMIRLRNARPRYGGGPWVEISTADRDALLAEITELRMSVLLADALIERAPIHHFGKDYEAWREKREEYRAQRQAGENDE